MTRFVLFTCFADVKSTEVFRRKRYERLLFVILNVVKDLTTLMLLLLFNAPSPPTAELPQRRSQGSSLFFIRIADNIISKNYTSK